MRSSDGYDSLLGFDSRNGLFRVAIAGPHVNGIMHPSEVVSIATRAQCPFTCRKFFVHAPVADDFVIREITIGRASQMANGQAPIICSPFALRGDALPIIEKAIERDGIVKIKIDGKSADLVPDLRLPKACAGMEITLCVENIGSVPRRFLAAMIGESDKA